MWMEEPSVEDGRVVIRATRSYKQGETIIVNLSNIDMLLAIAAATPTTDESEG